MNKIYYVSNDNGEVEYLYICEDIQEVTDQLEGDETVQGSAYTTVDLTGWPTNRRLSKQS